LRLGAFSENQVEFTNQTRIANKTIKYGMEVDANTVLKNREWLLFTPVILIPFAYCLKSGSFFYSVLFAAFLGLVYGWILSYAAFVLKNENIGNPQAGGMISGVFYGIIFGATGKIIHKIEKHQKVTRQGTIENNV
jgi:hypothetical protein